MFNRAPQSNLQLAPLQNMQLEILQNAINELHATIKAPLGMTVLSSIMPLSLVIQHLYDVELPFGSVVPTSMMNLISAESGERKSALDDKTMKPIKDFQKKEQESHADAVKSYNAEIAVRSQKEKSLNREYQRLAKTGECTEDVEVRIREFEESKPEMPTLFKMLYKNTTHEALAAGLKFSCPTAGLISAEGMDVLGSGGFNNIAMINSLWSNEDIIYDRKSVESFVLSDVRLTVSIMVQPEAIKNYVEKRGGLTRGSGLWARFLVCDPPSTQGGRYLSNLTSSTEHVDRYHARLNELLEENRQLLSQPEKRRKVLKFSHEAKQEWMSYFNTVEGQINPGQRYHMAGDHASKLAENAARLAALLHVFEGNVGEISQQTLQYAILIVNAASEGFRSLFMAPPSETIDAMTLNEWLSARYRSQGFRYIRKNTILQYCPSILRSKNKLNPALDLLVMQRQIGLWRKNKTTVVDLMPHLQHTEMGLMPYMQI